MSWTVEPLTADHERDHFDCGEELLNGFLKRLAGQYRKKNLGQTYVIVTPEKRVVGYYTLSTSLVDFESIPDELRRRLPQIPVPVVLLGRLAVDRTCQGKGVGKALLVSALRQAGEVAERIGVAAVEVHALNDQARQFYLKYGFTPLVDDRCHLYLPMRTIRKLLDEGDPA